MKRIWGLFTARLVPAVVAGRAVEMVGMKSDAAKLTSEAMVRKLTIAERLGCLEVQGLAAMKRGAISQSLNNYRQQ
ncbi:MAG: hypothetical protein NTW03_03025 [Verrucomicrobia bacterium]|nr:hypothetical protein [Verrucomicrobiota bacterium]